jgi:hypothetical protein
MYDVSDSRHGVTKFTTEDHNGRTTIEIVRHINRIDKELC